MLTVTSTESLTANIPEETVTVPNVALLGPETDELTTKLLVEKSIVAVPLFWNLTLIVLLVPKKLDPAAHQQY